MEPTLYTVTALMVDRNNRILARREASDLTEHESRELMRNFRASGWETRRKVQ